MKPFRATAIAAGLLIAMSGAAGATVKQPSTIAQSGTQPAARPMSTTGGTGLMAKKHGFLAQSKAGPNKDKAHGWVAPAKTSSKGNSKP